jgi:hypothetical protein
MADEARASEFEAMRTALICMSILATAGGPLQPALAGATSFSGPLPAATAAIDPPAQPGPIVAATPPDTLDLSWRRHGGARTTHAAATLKLSSARGCGPATADWLELTVLDRGS